MSWDISVVAAASLPPTVEEMPNDWKGVPLGPCEFVRNQLSTAVPAIDWSDPKRRKLEGNGYSIEFNIGDSEPCDSMMLHIRGIGENNGLFDVLRSISEIKGWYALDIAQGEWFHHGADPLRGLEKFNELKDEVLEKLNAKPFWKRWLGI